MLLLVTAGAAASIALGTWCGLFLLKPVAAVAPRPQLVLAMAANLALVTLAWGSVALAIAAVSKRRATAVAIVGLMVFVTYVLDYVGRFWHGVAMISRVSPFHYYNPMQIIGGAPARAGDIAVLTLLAVAGCLVAHTAYAKRDL
jgi:ABC-2 type transport system permease protein